MANQCYEGYFEKIKFICSKEEFVKDPFSCKRHQIDDNFYSIRMFDIQKVETLEELEKSIFNSFQESYEFKIASQDICFVNRSDFELKKNSFLGKVIPKNRMLGQVFKGICTVVTPMIIEILPEWIQLEIQSEIGKERKTKKKKVKVYAGIYDVYIDLGFYAKLPQGYIHEDVQYKNVFGQKQSLRQNTTEDTMAENFGKTQQIQDVWKILLLRYLYHRIYDLNVNFHQKIVIRITMRQMKGVDDFNSELSDGMKKSLKVAMDSLVPSWQETVQDVRKLWNGYKKTRKQYQKNCTLGKLFRLEEDTLESMDLETATKSPFLFVLQFIGSNSKSVSKNYRKDVRKQLYDEWISEDEQI